MLEQAAGGGGGGQQLPRSQSSTKGDHVTDVTRLVGGAVVSTSVVMAGLLDAADAAADAGDNL